MRLRVTVRELNATDRQTYRRGGGGGRLDISRPGPLARIGHLPVVNIVLANYV